MCVPAGPHGECRAAMRTVGVPHPAPAPPHPHHGLQHLDVCRHGQRRTQRLNGVKERCYQHAGSL